LRWAEQQVFKAFTQLNDGWTVIYSLLWHGERNNRNGDGEADFLLLHPRNGFLVVEVKGGSEVLVKDGEWFSRKRGELTKIRDPFEQALSSSKTLGKWLKKNLPDIKIPPISHFVVFPSHVQRGDMSPAGRREIICDANDLAAIEQTIRRISQHWNRTTNLSDQDIIGVQKALRPDITFFSNMRSQVQEAQAEIAQLTNQQARILDALRRNKKLLVLGSAGTGKTVLALNSAKQLAASGMRTLFLCFNTPLAKFLKAETRAIKNLTTDSFHGFARRIIDAAGLPLDDLSDIAFLLAEAADVLSREYDALVIDEAQDFKNDWCEALEGLLPTDAESVIHIFADSNQDIYEGDGLDRFQNLLPVDLTINCRNTIEIAEVVHECGHIDTTPFNNHGPKPKIELVSAMSGIHRHLKSYLGSWTNEIGLKPHEMTVICDTQRIADSLFDSNLGVIHLGDGSNGTINTDTIHRFKGLEAEAVVCIFDPERGAELSLDEFERLAYIGLSRARTLLTILGNKTTLERFQSLGVDLFK